MINSTMFPKDQHYKSFFDGNFKQPMAPTNGTKRIPALLSAAKPSFTFNKPHQTINPHYSQYGEPTNELKNFKHVPDLYPINRSNISSASLINGNDKPPLFSSTKYDNNMSTSRFTQNNSRSLIDPSKSYFGNTSKLSGSKGDSMYLTVSH